MNNLLYRISSLLLISFWPVSFYLANREDGFTYTLAALVIAIGWYLYHRQIRLHFFIYLLLPLLHPAFLFFPIIAFVFWSKGSRWQTVVAYAALLIVVVLISWKSFYAYSIFTPDPLAFDTLNKKISLIPNRNLARIFHNKTDIFQDKFKANIFTALDPNNYFFALHPREIFESQNLLKFPFIAIIPFLTGLYFLIKSKTEVWMVTTLLAGIFSIALINNPDKFDLILYLPLALVCMEGLRKIFTLRQDYYLLFSLIFFPLSVIELVRVILK